MTEPFIEMYLLVDDGKKEKIVFGRKIAFTEESFTKEKIAFMIKHIANMILFQISQKELIDKENLNIPDNLLERIYSKLNIVR